MAIRFSQVTAEADGSEVTFLVNGIPKDYYDLENWTAFRDLVNNLESDTTVHIHTDTFVNGSGEVLDATIEEVAYMYLRMSWDNGFLGSICQHTGTTHFDIEWSPEELFGQSFKT